MTPYLFCPTEGVMGNAAEHHDCDHRHGVERGVAVMADRLCLVLPP